MKRNVVNRLGIRALAVLILAVSGSSCQKQETLDDGGTACGFTVRAVLDEGSADSRTSMSPNADEESYAVHWEESDCISINGVKSESITIQEDRRSAEFGFLQGFETALHAAYPASAVSEYADGEVTLVLPGTQIWSESDQYDPAAALMLARAESDEALHFKSSMRWPICG